MLIFTDPWEKGNIFFSYYNQPLGGIKDILQIIGSALKYRIMLENTVSAEKGIFFLLLFIHCFAMGQLYEVESHNSRAV